MGNIIGKQGTTIKRIRDVSGARMIASKEMLPQSTERIIEIQGEVKSIGSALKQILSSMAADWNRYSGTVLFNPQFSEIPGLPSNYLLPGPIYTPESTLSKPYNGTRGNSSSYNSNRPAATVLGGNRDSSSVNGTSHLITQTMSIPKDMVGCIIGKAGSKISEIRRLSGSRISISKEDESPLGERTFTILGTAEANQKALNLLYGQMQFESERRQKLSQDLKPRNRQVGNGNLAPQFA
jgi:heterogeneous nuclear rnp K-like protein 2